MHWGQLLAWAERHQLPPDARAELQRLFMEGEGATVLLEPDEARPDELQDERTWAGDDAPPQERWLTPRYRWLADLGEGAMGEVVRAYDVVLEREVALKILRDADETRRARLAAFFNAEARAIAGLEHPNIVPIHDLGTLADGRLFFSMKEIRGQSFTRIITEVHKANHGARSWRPSPSGWTLRRLLGVLHRACEAVAHAHARGVIHRDLKPDNIMVGDLGDVLVVDWGLALDISEPTGRHEVAGTPVYMAPEQASGILDHLSTATDVYALGAILHQILSGKLPRWGTSTTEILEQARTTPPGRCVPPIDVDEDLLALRDKAMSWDPTRRFASARDLAERLGEWLDGALQRERAMTLVHLAAESLPNARLVREQARADEEEARRMLLDIPSHSPASSKRDAWALQDRAARRRADADLEELRVLQLLQSALTYAPDLSEAHQALAEHHRRQHEQAEARHDTLTAQKHELLLRTHDRLGLHAHYLDGLGSLSLHTEPPGAKVELLRHHERDRILVAEPERSLGESPILDAQLPPGSYLLILSHPACEPVRYPIAIRRGGAWTTTPPHQSTSRPVWLPPAGSLRPDEVYIPGGWMRLSEVDVHGERGERDLWVDGFVMERHPVTNARYLEFLNALVREGRTQEAAEAAPRVRASTLADDTVYERTSAGLYQLRADADGDAWLPDYPVVLVDWHGAAAFAEWRARQDGRPWRLPTEHEWSKAAHGVDGRRFPWGDRTDPSFANLRGSLKDRPLPATIDAFPTDCSVYGVRGLAGNVRDWVSRTPTADNAQTSSTMGGAWALSYSETGFATRLDLKTTSRLETLGFRLVYATDSD